MRTSVALGLGVAGGLAISWLWQRLRSHPSWRKAICGSAAQTQTPPRSAFKMEDRLSLVARAKRPAPLRGLLPISKTPGVVNMAGGTPHPSLFPVKSYTLELVDGAKLVVDDATRVAAAQQYMHDVTPGVGTVGYLPLLAWLRTHVVEQHAPPYEGWDVCVCTGNADGFQRAWEALLDPGDTMLCDALDFAFSTAQLAAWTGARGLRVEALPETRSGDAAAELRALLDSWREQRPGVAFPKAYFTITTFQNPTCANRDAATIAALYTVCADHGLLIIEDDPYRLLAFGDALAGDDAPVPGARPDALPPSFLAHDVDGRVLRCDTFSKVLGPGLRCGYITAPRPVILKIAQGTGPSLGVSSSVQVHLMAMLDHWGSAGYHAHASRVQAAYRHRCAVMLRAADDHLTGLATWDPPTGGMFLWMRLLHEPDTALLVEELARARVCVVPGAYFWHGGTASGYTSSYVRASFAYASDEMLVEGFKRLGALLRERKAARS